jgi:hypothetical protein
MQKYELLSECALKINISVRKNAKLLNDKEYKGFLKKNIFFLQKHLHF